MKFTFVLTHQTEGWYGTSPNVPGLLVCSGTINGALSDIGKALNDMALAAALSDLDGKPTKPIFKKE